MSVAQREWLAAQAGRFAHEARAAVVAPDYPDQRRFGADRVAAYDGVADRRGAQMAAVMVGRFGGARHAEVSVAMGRGETTLGMLVIELDAAGLRELARCLLDAAADIEGASDAGGERA